MAKDKIVFLGKVFPERLKVSLKTDFTINYQINEINVPMEFQVEINEAAIRATCIVENYKPEWLSWLYNYALDFSRAQIDIVGFARGGAFEISFERAELPPNGNITDLAFEVKELSNICLAFDINNGTQFSEVLRIILKNPNDFLAFSEASLALRHPNQRMAACARAMERVRNSISPHESLEGKSWETMRNVLQIDRAYIQAITDASREHRHGRLEFKTGGENEEILKRTWTILNRFIIYRKGGSSALLSSQYPTLT